MSGGGESAAGQEIWREATLRNHRGLVITAHAAHGLSLSGSQTARRLAFAQSLDDHGSALSRHDPAAAT